MMMIPMPLHVVPGQNKKILKALKKKKGCRICVKKEHGGEHILVLEKRHMDKYRKAPHGTKLNLPFKHEELMHNLHHKGGFLPLIAAALAPVIGGIAGGLIEREIAGSGIHRPKQLYTLEKSGRGLRLNPWAGQM